MDPNKVEMLNDGSSPMYEPGFKEMFPRNVKQNRLRFKTDLTEGLKAAKFPFIAVGTPENSAGSAKLDYVK